MSNVLHNGAVVLMTFIFYYTMTDVWVELSFVLTTNDK